jgi:hypothetical protein
VEGEGRESLKSDSDFVDNNFGKTILELIRSFNPPPPTVPEPPAPPSPTEPLPVLPPPTLPSPSDSPSEVVAPFDPKSTESERSKEAT